MLLPIDATDSPNSACPKPHRMLTERAGVHIAQYRVGEHTRRSPACCGTSRATPCGNQSLDGHKYKSERRVLISKRLPFPLEMHNRPLQHATALCFFFVFFNAFAKARAASRSEWKRLSRPQLVLATQFDRSASQVTPL